MPCIRDIHTRYCIFFTLTERASTRYMIHTVPTVDQLEIRGSENNENERHARRFRSTIHISVYVCIYVSFCFFGSSYLASLCLVFVSAAGLQRVISNSTSDSSR